jgi:hypothetical protein
VEENSRASLVAEKLKSANEFNDLFDQVRPCVCVHTCVCVCVCVCGRDPVCLCPCVYMQYQRELAVHISEATAEADGTQMSGTTRLKRLLAFRERIMDGKRADTLLSEVDDSLSDAHSDEGGEAGLPSMTGLLDDEDDEEGDPDEYIQRVKQRDLRVSRQPSVPAIVDGSLTPPLANATRLAPVEEGDAQAQTHADTSASTSPRRRPSNHDAVRISDLRSQTSTLKRYCKKLKEAKFELEKEKADWVNKYRRMTQIADRLSMKLEDLSGRFLQHTRRKRMILEDQTRKAQQERRDMLHRYSKRDWSQHDQGGDAAKDLGIPNQALKQQALEIQQANLHSSTPAQLDRDQQQQQQQPGRRVDQPSPGRRKLHGRTRQKRHSTFHKSGHKVGGAPLPTIYSPRASTGFDYNDQKQAEAKAAPQGGKGKG